MLDKNTALAEQTPGPGRNHDGEQAAICASDCTEMFTDSATLKQAIVEGLMGIQEEGYALACAIAIELNRDYL